MIVVVMGVSGAGKTLIGSRVADSLGWPFYDADDFHPAANIARMRSGLPLTDSDRRPWTERLCALLADIDAAGADAVLACSALGENLRAQLRASASDVIFVFLKGSFELFEARLRQRTEHFFGVELLRSQFEALEEPTDAIVIDADQLPEVITRQIVDELTEIRPTAGSAP